MKHVFTFILILLVVCVWLYRIGMYSGEKWIMGKAK